MNYAETGDLLAAVVAFDRRTVGETDIKAWSLAMTTADIQLPDALQAVAAHFATSRNWLMPVDIIQQVRQARQDAVRAAPVPQIPPNLHQSQERAWIKAYYAAFKGGHPDPQTQADQLLGVRRVEFPAHPERVVAIKELAKSKGI